MQEGLPSGLVVEGLSRSYRTAHHQVDVLRGVDLTLRSGEALAITGPSGSGKSTLLHIIGGLERPSQGRVALDGRCPHELSEPDLALFRRDNVGFVFQDHHLLPQFSVLQNVVLPALTEGRGGAADAAARARSLLEQVGLEERIRHRPAELSGGERQRVAIARALMNQPRLLLCDEPTGNLDRTTADAVTSLLFRLHQSERNILIVVTHSEELAKRFHLRVTLKDGALVDTVAA